MKQRLSFRPSTLAVGALLSAGMAGPALAQSSSGAQNLLDGKFVVSLGAFVLNSDVTARLDGQSTTNPEVDFDKTFGNDKSATRIRLDGLWRITPAHHLRFMYFDYSRDATRVLDRDVQWGDYTFNVGGTIASESKMRTTELAYEWAFMRQPSYEVAATLGVHYTDLSLKLSGDATVNGTPVAGAVKTSNLPAPLPVIGLRGGWVVSPAWYLDAQVQFFKIGMNGYDGSLSDWRVGATWMYSKNFGVGAGWNRFTTKVDVDRDEFNGTLKTGYSGLQLFLTGAF
jgi:hypothetical protein